MNGENTKLGTQKIPKLILSFSTTVLAGLVFNSVYTLTDTLFISHAVGDNAMGGVSLILPFTILQGAIATTVGSGASAIVSRKLGEGKNGEAGNVTFNAMLIFYVTAIITTLLGFAFMNPLLKALGCTGELEIYAKEYFTIILLGNVFSTGFSSDIGWSNLFHMDSYVVTPGGFLKKYTYANRNNENGGVSVISNEVPWDPNSPHHR